MLLVPVDVFHFGGLSEDRFVAFGADAFRGIVIAALAGEFVFEDTTGLWVWRIRAVGALETVWEVNEVFFAFEEEFTVLGRWKYDFLAGQTLWKILLEILEAAPAVWKSVECDTPLDRFTVFTTLDTDKTFLVKTSSYCL